MVGEKNQRNSLTAEAVEQPKTEVEMDGGFPAAFPNLTEGRRGDMNKRETARWADADETPLMCEKVSKIPPPFFFFFFSSCFFSPFFLLVSQINAVLVRSPQDGPTYAGRNVCRI